jgi:hypothetical protein
MSDPKPFVVRSINVGNEMYLRKDDVIAYLAELHIWATSDEQRAMMAYAIRMLREAKP